MDVKLHSTLIAAMAVSAVAGATIIGANAAQAHSPNNGDVAGELAERFDLSEEEVSQFFEEQRAERAAERQAAREERLQALVDDGTITEEQKATLESFGEEIRAIKEEARENDQDRSVTKEAVMEVKAEIEEWADAEGIDLDDVRPDKEDRGHRRGHHKDHIDDDFEDEDDADDEEDGEEVDA